MSFNPCMDLCGQQGAEDTAEGRASNLAQAGMSCPALADQIASTKWLCTAEGASAYGYDMDGTLPDVRGSQDIYMLGTGATRASAVTKALNDCNSIMTLQLHLQRSMNLESTNQREWGASTTSPCHITQCIAPASTRKKSAR